jgi:hypothetical protein
MRAYRCPVCRKPLSKTEYERALGILGARETHFKKEKAGLLTRVQDAESRARRARSEGVDSERSRTRRLLEGKDKAIQALKDRVRQLRRGSTPQTEGLEFEDRLAARLRREFPDDEIQHAGKAGDIIHIVRHGAQRAGLIVYECKRTPSIPPAHIQQARAAKRQREADFAVLVTTGSRRSFTGFAFIDGVLVVAPLGAVPIAELLRAHILEMRRARLTKDERLRAVERLAKFIAGPQFKNPLDEIISRASNLESLLKREVKDHVRVWTERRGHYQRINWDGHQIRQNVQLVLHGKAPASALPPRKEPLRLPESAARHS